MDTVHTNKVRILHNYLYKIGKKRTFEVFLKANLNPL